MKYYFANLKWIEATCQIRLKTEALNSWDKLRVEQVVLCVHILFNFYNSFHWMNWIDFCIVLDSIWRAQMDFKSIQGWKWISKFSSDLLIVISFFEIMMWNSSNMIGMEIYIFDWIIMLFYLKVQTIAFHHFIYFHISQ